MTLSSWGIVWRRAALLVLAVVGVSLYVAEVAGAWSYYYANVEGTYQLGGEITFKVNGSLPSEQRIFVFVESMKCEGTPAREDAAPSGRALTPPEGEPIGPGSYAKEYTWSVAALHELSGICAYIGSYAPAEGERDWASNFCEQEPGSNVEVGEKVSCSIPAVSWPGPIFPQPSGVLTPEALEARKREQTQAREAAEHAKQTETVRCTVPGLYGHTLRGSRVLLSRAHCSLGKVQVRHHGQGPLRVIAQTPKRNTEVPSGARVSLTLGHRSK